MYLMYEAFARERMRTNLDRAARARLSDQVLSLRRWQRLASYSDRRVARSRRRLAERAAADHQLVA